MEIVDKFVEKHASASFKICTNDALTHQFNDMIKQCDEQNANSKHRKSNKKTKKEKLANMLCMLMKMKEIAEQKELQWYSEKAQLRGELDRVEQGITVAIASAENDGCECEDLREEVDRLVQQNCDLEDEIEEYEERCRLRDLKIASLEEKEERNDDVVKVLKDRLHDVDNQLIHKQHCNMTLRSQESANNHCCGDQTEEQPICTADGPQSTPDHSSSLFTPLSDESRQRRDSLHIHGSNRIQSTTLSIQDKTNLCQILGKFDTSASPINLSNRLEAVVTQYNLNNRDACALFRVWLPSQLCEKLQPPVGTHKGLSAELNSNWGNASDRLKELQRVMGGRDIRGTNALENAKLRRGDDPIIFCSEYLTLFRATYNCPDMPPDDSSFLYSMANKCTFVDFQHKYWWENMKDTVVRVIQECLICAQMNPRPKGQRPVLSRIPLAEGPWERLQIDFVGPLPSAPGGYRYLLVVIDVFSKWVEALPMRRDTAIATAKALWREVISRWGFPKTIESDRGTHFTGKIMTGMCEMLNVEQKFHVPYHPQSSGMVERMNRTLKERLKKMVLQSGNNWLCHLPTILMAIRGTEARGTSITPYQLMTGRIMNLCHPADPKLSTPMRDSAEKERFLAQLQDQVQKYLYFAASNMAPKAKEEPGRPPIKLEVGDRVMVKNFVPKSSWDANWMGPFLVTVRLSDQVVKVKRVDNKKGTKCMKRRDMEKWVHADQCKRM
ncbi:posterior protein-like [Bufo bufo]|uniref:posterior protein-like n=1 Tax=Bufo bufo TaxID=8384 RepID=UPI001ABE1A60|nr:posterior protein-like [Bufo bufo]